MNDSFNSLQKIVRSSGFPFEDAVEAGSYLVDSTIKNREIAYLFVLEELDAAYCNGLNEFFSQRVLDIGIPVSDFQGTLNGNSAIDGPNGPQQTLLRFCQKVSPSREIFALLKWTITENIIKKYNIGKDDIEEDDNWKL